MIYFRGVENFIKLKVFGNVKFNIIYGNGKNGWEIIVEFNFDNGDKSSECRRD